MTHEAQDKAGAPERIVKALEWHKHDRQDIERYSAGTHIADHIVTWTAGGYDLYIGAWGSAIEPRLGPFASLADAKAAAQANYERRILSALAPQPAPAQGLREALTETVIEDAAKSAFVKAQSVYRSDHDHFPLKFTWETTDERVREGWRTIAYAALEAALLPPLGTQPEPRQPRDVAAALAQDQPATDLMRSTITTRNEEAGYTETVNEDVPVVVRELHGSKVDILLDANTRQIVGYRLWDTPAQVSGERLTAEQVADHIGVTPHSDMRVHVVAAVNYARKQDALTATEQEAQSGWRDIASAPKDGTQFIAFEADDVYRCNWLEQQDGEGRFSEGWWDHVNQSYENPTGWLPLPAAPASDKEAGR